MKVEIAMCNHTENYIIFEDVQEWDTCETIAEVYKAAQKEFGRCVSKMYIDTDDPNKPKHVGWVFEKKQKYEDTKEFYIQETWITPLIGRKTKVIREYAIQ